MELLRNVTIILKKNVIFVLACTVKAEKKNTQPRQEEKADVQSFLLGRDWQRLSYGI